MADGDKAPAKAKQVERYPLDELLTNCQQLFGCSPEVVHGAVFGSKQEMFTVDELKQLIDKFKKQKVNV